MRAVGLCLGTWLGFLVYETPAPCRAHWLENPPWTRGGPPPFSSGNPHIQPSGRKPRLQPATCPMSQVEGPSCGGRQGQCPLARGTPQPRPDHFPTAQATCHHRAPHQARHKSGNFWEPQDPEPLEGPCVGGHFQTWGGGSVQDPRASEPQGGAGVAKWAPQNGRAWGRG